MLLFSAGGNLLGQLSQSYTALIAHDLVSENPPTHTVARDVCEQHERKELVETGIPVRRILANFQQNARLTFRPMHTSKIQSFFSVTVESASDGLNESFQRFDSIK